MCLCPFDQLFDVVGTSAGLLACERWHVVGRYVYNALSDVIGLAWSWILPSIQSNVED